ncbi:MAG: class I SAM-dependent methyltransferase, partial [Opitutaceae bacterium]
RRTGLTMPKKILFESAVHQFLWAGSRLRQRLGAASAEDAGRLAAWLNALQIENPGAGQLRVSWPAPAPGEHVVEFKSAKFYTRGDTAAHAQQQQERGLVAAEDRVMSANMAFFDDALRTTLVHARVFDEATLARGFAANAAPGRRATEEAFHDEWAATEDVTQIDVRRRNEACTAPEMRHLRSALGDLRGKELLDIGCGLGEASVYFALEGARVTATDVSPGMCDATRRLAEANRATLTTHVSAAEDLRLGARQFDVIYTGNTLHHADLEATMDRLLPHLRADGTFVSWDPVAYNPLINLYRRIATQVRTPDEHPLRLRDVRSIASRFAIVEVRWFWLTTLLVFVCMVAVQGRNPNRERFWKKVVDEADDWAWLYRPLERFDRVLLKCLPFLRPLCWNVVIVGRGPRRPILAPHA